MSIEKLDPLDIVPKENIITKLNELIDAYNQHVHYARELQFPTSTPDNTNPYKEPHMPTIYGDNV